jgi:two-component system CheB/CheR fusion protein
MSQPRKRPARRQRPPARAPVKRRRPVAAPVFPVVGIGASAGGLEALELFLRHVPARSGSAFVVVQHLDPTHKGALVELLQRASRLPVVQVTDGTRVAPGVVYVIPPNADLSIVHGVLHLLVPAAPRGLRLPIDFFLRSLADDLRHAAVGVLLSGMGSDGTMGLRAIHENAGATFVQEPASAKFDAMPRSAIDAGVADFVAPAGELPGKIAEYLGHADRLVLPEAPDKDPRSRVALDKIVGLLRTATGHDFSSYKTSTILRRIERRMSIHRIDGIGHYVRYLRDNPKEAQLLFDELLIGVTRFFRDPEAWERLKRDVLPGLIARSPDGGTVRAWVPACSTGEEAYSLAVVFGEALAKHRPAKKIRLQLFATDLDAHAVEKARQAFYPRSIGADVSPARLARFFVEEDQGYRVRKEVRDRVVFAVQNVAQDPPFTKLDLLACRNLLIYLSPEVQRRLLPLFHYSLRSGGILFLGGAETVGTFTDLYASVDDKSRIYRRRDSALAPRFAFHAGSARPPAEDESTDLEPAARGALPPSLQAVVERLLLERFAPAAVLSGVKGDVLYVSGRTGKYLELPAGKANWNVLAMARDGLRQALSAGLHKVVHSQAAMTLPSLRVITDAGAQLVNVALQPVDEPGVLPGTVLIVFQDAAPAETEVGRRGRARPAAVVTLDRELQQARDELRTTRDEAQTAHEELKSANEELQSTNEELQSTNEELTTSKEEMQSMNEELQTLNSELQAKVDDLSRTSNDMRNLLDSTEIAVLFLDEGLNVRRFTPQAAKLIKLIPGDVGRPLADLASELDYSALYDDAREVLRTLVFTEKSVASRGGARFTVRIMPYRTADNRIDGLVITFTKNAVEGAGSNTARRER